MKEVRCYEDVIKIAKESSVVIWGAGNIGTELIYELNLAGFSDYYVSDIEYKSYIKNYIFPEDIFKVTGHNLISIIIAVKSDKAASDIKVKIYSLLHDADEYYTVEIYRYIQETVEEMISRRKTRGFYNGRIYRQALEDDNAVNALIGMITGSTPFLFSRWGIVEGDSIYKMRAGRYLLPEDCMHLKQWSGVFPVTERVLKKYSKIMENAAREIDILCAFYWHRHLEKLIEWYSPNAVITSSVLEYPFFVNPWTKVLAGMRVLVVHPFAELITKQYKRRDKLFANTDVLPEFDLITYKAVQSLGGSDAYRDWVEALYTMQDEISKMDFDIALIGCGAYGMPLGAFIKSQMHKKAIHMGGSLQILFGIKGKRWESEGYNYHNVLYNEYWVRPTDDLKPQNYKAVEDGCYW